MAGGQRHWLHPPPTIVTPARRTVNLPAWLDGEANSAACLPGYQLRRQRGRLAQRAFRQRQIDTIRTLREENEALKEAIEVIAGVSSRLGDPALHAAVQNARRAAGYGVDAGALGGGTSGVTISDPPSDADSAGEMIASMYPGVPSAGTNHSSLGLGYGVTMAQAPAPAQVPEEALRAAAGYQVSLQQRHHQQIQMHHHHRHHQNSQHGGHHGQHPDDQGLLSSDAFSSMLPFAVSQASHNVGHYPSTTASFESLLAGTTIL